VPRKLIGTLTLSILNSVHTSISPIFLHRLCSAATPEHSETLLIGNYVRIVALASDLREVSFYSATELLHHNFTVELLSLLILIKGSYPSFKAHYHARKSLSAFWLLWYANSCKVATRVGTFSPSDQRILVSAERPRTSRNNP